MKEKIIEIVAEMLQVDSSLITENTLMEEIEEWDSLVQVMIIGEIEQRLGLSIDLEDAMEVTGVADLIRLCEK